MMTRKLIGILLLALFALMLVHFSNPLRSGAAFEKAGDLDAVMNSKGFGRMGTWNDVWPARIVQVSRSRDGITFITAKGQSTIYQDAAYAGLDFIHLRMKHETEGEFDLLYNTTKSN